MHDLSIIVTLVGGLTVALILGWVTQRLGLTTLLGYMLAGVVVGPFTPGFTADTKLAQQMAEIGVIFLMFGVGMHFHPQELLRVWRIAVPGAVAQSVVATVAGWYAARHFGFPNTGALVFGMALAVASTVVLMRVLMERDRLGAHDGHVAVGWLIVEDLFTVIALVVLPALAQGLSNPKEMGAELAIAVGKAGLFAVLVWFAGSRLVQPVMERIARTKSAELFTLTIFVVALGVAIIAAEVFHVSVALGAFFAGLVVGRSRFGAQAASDMAPFRDVFSALFFVSIGMLFNPDQLTERPGLLLSALAVVLVVKPLVALAIVMLLRDTKRTALTVAIGLAQIGEFSFILAALGRSLDLFPREGMDALVGAAIVSIALNPLLFRLLPRLESALGRSRDVEPEAPASTLAAEGAPVVITGMGELGRRVAQRATSAGIAVFVIDPRIELLDALDPALGRIYGDPGRDDVLRAAKLGDAHVLVVTSPTLAEKMRICMAARRVNPRIALVATAESSADRAWLNEFGASVVDAVDEMGEALLRAVRRSL
jgi:CPA2 family monovalent cation:H+ antiporter-2